MDSADYVSCHAVYKAEDKVRVFASFEEAVRYTMDNCAIYPILVKVYAPIAATLPQDARLNVTHEGRLVLVF